MSLEQFVSGGVWNVARVDLQPSMTLVRWQIYEVPNGDRHFSGWAVENREGRASSAIRTFDPSTMTGVTSSGRVYRLQGPPGEDSDGLYVWHRWARINGTSTWAEKSADIMAHRPAK
jgi:hypothetical protein